MLEEFRDLRQYPGEKLRKNFYGPYYDLYIWYESDCRICAFELCYGAHDSQHMLEWYNGRGFRHFRIDNGDVCGGMKRTPIALADGPFPYKEVIDGFLDSMAGSDRTYLNDFLFVYDKMIEYTNSGGELV